MSGFRISKMPEQVSGMPGILGRDQIDRLENGERAQRDVIEISNRRADDIKHRRIIHPCPVPREHATADWKTAPSAAKCAGREGKPALVP